MCERICHLISLPNSLPKYEELTKSPWRNGSLSENDLVLEKKQQSQTHKKTNKQISNKKNSPQKNQTVHGLLENYNLKRLLSHSPSTACVKCIYGLSPIPSRQVPTSVESPGGDD